MRDVARNTAIVDHPGAMSPRLFTADQLTDQLAWSDNPLEILPTSNKNSLRPERSDVEEYGTMAAIAGAIGHRRRAADITLGYADAVQYASVHYNNRPLYYLLLSELGHVASTIIDDLQVPSPDLIAHRIADVKWRVGKGAVAAAATLGGMLHEERDSATLGQQHPLEEALRTCGFFRAHTYTEGPGKGFRGFVSGLPNTEEVVELSRTARTHYLTNDGDLIMSQNAIADEMVFTHPKDDLYATRVTSAFMQILGSRRSLDADAMSRIKILVLPADVPDGTALTSKERERYFKNGNEVVASYVSLLMQGKVHCSLQELKFSTGLGETPATDRIWEANDYDLSKVLWHALKRDEGDYLQTHKKLKAYEYDAIKTKGVLKNVIRVALMGYFKQAGSRGRDIGELHVGQTPGLADIMSRFGLGLYIARMDLRNGWELPPTASDLKKLPYRLDHPLHRLRVPFPEDIQVASLGVTDQLTRQKTPKWERALYQAIRLGRLSVLSQQEDAGSTLFDLPR
jgi:hypothetical protein